MSSLSFPERNVLGLGCLGVSFSGVGANGALGNHALGVSDASNERRQSVCSSARNYFGTVFGGMTAMLPPPVEFAPFPADDACSPPPVNNGHPWGGNVTRDDTETYNSRDSEFTISMVIIDANEKARLMRSMLDELEKYLTEGFASPQETAAHGSILPLSTRISACLSETVYGRILCERDRASLVLRDLEALIGSVRAKYCA